MHVLMKSADDNFRGTDSMEKDRDMLQGQQKIKVDDLD